MSKSSLSRMVAVVACCAAANVSPAQTESPAPITFKTIASFTGSNGANPGYGNLVQGKDGNLYGTTEVSGGADGTVFKISTAGKVTPLHFFCKVEPCPDGSKPLGGLVLAKNGNFYGTTTLGGKANNGTVFQITTAGKLTTIHSFVGSDGSVPWAAPFQAADNDLYGTTSLGGSKDDGALYEMTTAGKLTASVSFIGTNGIHPYGPLIQGSDKNYYGTTSEVTSGDGTVFAIKEDGLTTLHKFTPRQGGYLAAGLIQAKSGILYGTTTIGGGNLAGGTVFSITTAGKLTTLYSFCAKNGCPDGSGPEGTLIQASDGNLYGTTYQGGPSNENCNAGCGTIFRITPAGKFTTLYNFCSKQNCADGYQPEAGLVQATNGTLYGTTYYGGTDESGTVFSLSLGLPAFVKILPRISTAGATVTILGDNLRSATRVAFNGIAAEFTVISDTEIQATVPRGATTGTVTVQVAGRTLKSDVDVQLDENAHQE